MGSAKYNKKDPKASGCNTLMRGKRRPDRAVDAVERDPWDCLGFIAAVKVQMSNLGIRQKQLATLLNVSESYVSQILNLPSNLSAFQMKKIANALEMTLEIHTNGRPE